jgi:hypothetical protein
VSAIGLVGLLLYTLSFGIVMRTVDPMYVDRGVLPRPFAASHHPSVNRTAYIVYYPLAKLCEAMGYAEFHQELFHPELGVCSDHAEPMALYWISDLWLTVTEPPG